MVDIKDFYLNMPMERYEYMKVKVTDIPTEIIREYKLQELVSAEGYVYCEIWKGMYGLPQAGIIAQEYYLKNGSQIMDTIKAKLFRDSGSTIPNHYASPFASMTLQSNSQTGAGKRLHNHCGLAGGEIHWIDIKRDYANGKVHIHMPGYIEKTLKRFKHDHPSKAQNSPHLHKITGYGTKVQYADDDDDSPPSIRTKRNTSRR